MPGWKPRSLPNLWSARSASMPGWKPGLGAGAACRPGRLIPGCGALGGGTAAALGAGVRAGTPGRSGRLITRRGTLRGRSAATLGAGVRAGAASRAGGLARRGGSGRRTPGRAVTCLLVTAGFYLLVVASTAVALGPGVVLTVDIAVAVGIALCHFALAGIDGSMSVLICAAAALGTGRARAALRPARSVARAEGDHLFGCAGLAQSRWIRGMYIRDCRDRAGLTAGLDDQR